MIAADLPDDGHTPQQPPPLEPAEIEELRKAKIYAESIVETIHEPLLVLTPDLRVRSANPAFYEHFEVDRASTEGRLIYELGNGQWNIPALRTLLEDVLPDSNVFNDFKVVHRFESIGERVMLINARRLDHVQFILLGIRDITEKHQAEAALRASEARLRALFDQTSVGIAQTDLNGRFTTVNQRYCEIVGRSAEELTRLRYSDITHPADAAENKPLFQGMVDTGESFIIEKRYLRPDGTSVWVNNAVTLIRDADGTPLHVMAVSFDVTAKKAAEELSRSNEALEQFAYVASHDLKEPLRKVQTFAGLLADEFGDVLGDTGRVYVERLQSASARMRALIDDLLTFSRVSTAPTSAAVVDLNTIVRGVLEDLEPRLKEKGADVEVEALPRVLANATQMRQLMQNLIANALKFHPPGVPPVVRVSAEPAEFDARGFQMVRVLVEDRGIGIEPQYLERIFKPFERLHGRGAYEGTGMGLAICKRIADRHGGSIAVRSESGTGSTFIVELPAT